MTGSPEASIELIEQAAAGLAKEILSRECDPMVEIFVDFGNVYEVRGLRRSLLDPFSTAR